MFNLKFILRILPWFLLVVMILTLYLSNYSIFPSKKNFDIVESTTILQEIEQLGKLELVKYNFQEIYDYRQLSEGKLVGSSILKIHDYTPDLNVILVASGEAVGCIDLSKMDISDVSVNQDTILILLPSPELCYHKLNLDKTRIYSFKSDSWWNRLFSDENKNEEILQMAYRQTEKRIEEAAYESGILKATNRQAVLMLKPMLESMTGKNIQIITGIPGPTLFEND